MFTFQDFEKAKTESGSEYAVQKTISEYRGSQVYRIANLADKYDRQQNETIMEYTKILYSASGRPEPDNGLSNNKLCSNFFNRLNTQRCNYLLGNGVQFTDENTKDLLGTDFDTRLKDAGYLALIHGVSFVFMNVDHIHVFSATECAPLWDEESGTLRAVVRFWQISNDKPMVAVLYEEDGWQKFRGSSGGYAFKSVTEKSAYRITRQKATADAEPEVILAENYPSLPIVPVYGSRLHQSTLVGMRSKIDAFDLVSSGFASDLEECAEAYWLISGAGGMDEDDTKRFLDRLRHKHIANIGDDVGVSVTPYTQEIPTNARKTFLDEIRSSLYEDFGALDVYAISAANQTATAIESAYQPLDEQADDLEYQIINSVQNILRLIGVEDTPQFKRNRISNQKETTDMIMETVSIIGEESAIRHLPFITPEEAEMIINQKDIADFMQFGDRSEESDQ